MSLIETGQNQMDARVLFFDDFRSEALDRSKWNVRITGRVHNDEQQAYVDAAETIYIASAEQAPGAKHGALVLQPRYRPSYRTKEGEQFDFVSGRIDTRDKFDFKHGTASARIMLPEGPGLWPAFWLLGQESWPDSGEIDVMEYVGEPDWVSAAVHGPGYFGEAGLANRLFFAAEHDATAWHVYSVEWGPESLIFKVDGSTIYRVTRPMIDFFGPWVFDNDKFLILNFALGGTFPFKTNGVQAPYYGLPEGTVQMIKENRIRTIIDWVRVTGRV